MNGVERRGIEQSVAGVRIERRADGDGAGVLTGYAAVFYDPAVEGTEYELFEDHFERIMPGTFDRAVREDDCRGLFNHDANHVLGRTSAETMTLSVDKVGLLYRITMPDSAAAVVEAVERRDVTGSSFGFRVTDSVWREQDGMFIREIEGVELFDVGPVTFPAYPATSTEVAERSFDAWRVTQRRKRSKSVRRRLRLSQLRVTCRDAKPRG